MSATNVEAPNSTSTSETTEPLTPWWVRGCGFALVVFVILIPADPALADNCSGVFDCFGTAENAGIALLGTFLSLALDFVPIIGDIKGVIEGITGRDLITGQKLTPLERALGMMGLSELRVLGRMGKLDNLADLGKLGRETPTGRQLDALGRRWDQRPSVRPGSGTGPARPNGEWGHIIEGDIKGSKVGGGHHRDSFDNVPGSRSSSTGRPDRDGVYSGRIERDRLDAAGNQRTHPDGTPLSPATKQGDHTFFPDSWTPAQTRGEVQDAFANPTVTRTLPNGRTYWEGVSPSGVQMQGWADSTGELAAAWPVRLPDLNPTPGQLGRAIQDTGVFAEPSTTAAGE